MLKNVYFVVLFLWLFCILKVFFFWICIGVFFVLEEDFLIFIYVIGGGFCKKFWNLVLVINLILGIVLLLMVFLILDLYLFVCFLYLLRLVKKLGLEGVLKMVLYFCFEFCSLFNREDIFWFFLGMFFLVFWIVFFKFLIFCRYCWVNLLILFFILDK